MKTPTEVRKLAKSKFDSRYRFNQMIKDDPFAWSLWKVAFDAGYTECQQDILQLLETLNEDIT